MAVQWPGPVTFNDDDPKSGYCTLFLTTPGILPPGLGSSKPRNGSVSPHFSTGEVAIDIAVTKPAGSFQYKKGLPEDLKPEKCSIKVKKGMVVVTLCKAASGSWAAHARYMIKKD